MTELEKLDAGLEYDFWDAEVDGRKLHALEWCRKLNAIPMEHEEERTAAIRALFGSAGGATDARVFFSVSLPLAKVGLVSVILFMSLQYWNDFYLSLYLITKTDLYTLQKLLYNMMANISALLTNSSLQSAKEHIVLPSNTARMAMTVFTVLPVLVFYPFAQKYFVKGITVGAVKG